MGTIFNCIVSKRPITATSKSIHERTRVPETEWAKVGSGNEKWRKQEICRPFIEWGIVLCVLDFGFGVYEVGRSLSVFDPPLPCDHQDGKTTNLQLLALFICSYLLSSICCSWFSATYILPWQWNIVEQVTYSYVYDCIYLGQLSLGL